MHNIRDLTTPPGAPSSGGVVSLWAPVAERGLRLDMALAVRASRANWLRLEGAIGHDLHSGFSQLEKTSAASPSRGHRRAAGPEIRNPCRHKLR